MKKIRVRKCRCRTRSNFFNPSFRWRLGSHDWLFLMHLQTWVEWAKSLQISSPAERRLPPLSTATTTLTFLSPMSSSSAQHAAIIIRSTLSVGRISSSNTMKAKSVWAKNGTYSRDWQKTFDIEIGVWSAALTDRSSELKNDPIVVALKKIIVEQLYEKQY